MSTWKVYLAKLKRTTGHPKTVYKVGITRSSDALNRLTYQGADEPNPIVSEFPDIKVMHSVWTDSEDEALALEQNIMNTIKGSEKFFHNWYEPRQLSGITEMRKWNYDEIQQIFGIMNDYKNRTRSTTSNL